MAGQDPKVGSLMRAALVHAATSRVRETRQVISLMRPMGSDHGAAFLVAPIVSVEPAQDPNDAGRFDIRFAEFARVNKPNVWTGKRNRVNYTSLGELDINPDELHFDP